MSHEFLTQQETSDLLRCSIRTLARWRALGTGPGAHKAGGHVLYVRAEIESWLKSRRFSSTSEAQKALAQAAAA